VCCKICMYRWKLRERDDDDDDFRGLLSERDPCILLNTSHPHSNSEILGC
jgi:hypothetical protein